MSMCLRFLIVHGFNVSLSTFFAGSIVRKSPVKRHVPLATHDKLMKDLIRKQCEESLLNPTPSMLEVRVTRFSGFIHQILYKFYQI